MKINQINENTKQVELFARLEKTILSTGSNGSNYLILHLADNSGRVEARIWNSEDKDLDLLQPGSIVKVEGNINVYRKQLQLKVNHYQVINPGEFTLYDIQESDFIISAPLNIDKNYNILITYLENDIKNPVYKSITLALLKEHEEKFKTYPAAVSIHHNVVGGLFWHSFSVAFGSKELKLIYKYAEIDWDLVFCGAILHDIGKVVEMNGKAATDYTLEGKVLGHISIGNEFIYKKAIDLGIYINEDGSINEDVTKLQHCVLSSHGNKEFGSPVEPNLIEGVIISTFDNLDARIYKVNDELQKVTGQSWTPRIMSEDGRAFYRHYKKED